MSRLGRGLVLTTLLAAAAYALIAAAWGDLSRVGGYLVRFPLLPLAGAALLASLNYAFRFWRWQLYLTELSVAVPVLPSLAIFLAGFSLTLTPGKVGEVLKSYLLRARHGVPLARTAPIVVAERLTDLLALLLLGLCGAGSLMGRGELWLTGVGFALCALVLGTVASRRLAHGAIRLLGHLLPGGLRQRLLPRVQAFYDAAALLLRPRPLGWAVLLAVAAWMCECVAFLVILRTFAGVHSSLLTATFIYAMTTVAGALAFVPGGLGVTEGGMALLIVRLCPGADESVAVAATLLVRLVTLWFAVGLGLVALLLLRRIGGVAVNLDELGPLQSA
ncbi:MAG: lysylphosphatidylglycerol synthase transmembrane domain-containing protein [Myxococcales bacterium]|nr:flippase-like domain-containing protein [Myxococcota bacterium]MDW8283141.1 lysylphosphatidylglycerol synthase transmembrane domain-containing protein [Myxococcales bacterium]